MPASAVSCPRWAEEHCSSILLAMATHLDCKGLKCPMPIVRLSVAARELRPGDEITIEADDLAFRADLSAWARRTGFDVTEFNADGPVQNAKLTRRSS